MTAGTFGLTMILGVLALAGVPGWVARSRRTLFVPDLLLVLLPPCVFYVSGYFLNPELHVGFGLIVYPFLVLVASVAILYARVFVFDRLSSAPRRNSLLSLLVMCILAAAAGALIPPLAE